METVTIPQNSFYRFWKIPPAKSGAPYALEHPERGSNPGLHRFGSFGYLYVSLRGGALETVPAGSIRFNPNEAVENLLLERYRTVKESKSLCLAIYYKTKPLMPRAVQLLMRRLYSYRQRRKRFPAWPFDPSLFELYRLLLASEMKARGTVELPYLGFWPDGKRFCFVMTHDVESAEGFEAIEKLASIERERQVRSSWNIVPHRYPFSGEKLEALEAEGFEIGLHGLYHDGRLFSARRIFDERLPKINECLGELNSVGFRSPATHRNPDWITEIECLYDSSFPDSDPFEPQAGGSLSLFPYHMNGMLELPYTLPQDHTLFEILGESSPAIWIEKTERIARCGGMALAIVHPDYMTTEKRLDCVRALLDHVRARGDAWIATPREVCRWWQMRGKTDVVGNEVRSDGDSGSGGVRTHAARLEGDTLVLEAPGGPLETTPA